MLKHALVLTLSAVLMMGLGGCTSKKAADDESSADVAEVAGEGDAAMEGEGGDEIIADEGDADLGSDELSPDEQLPEEQGDVVAQEGGEAPAEGGLEAEGDLEAEGGLEAEGDDDFATPAEELADTPATEGAEGDMAAAVEPPGETIEPTPEPMEEPPPPAEEPLVAADPSEDMGSAPMEEAPAPAPVPLRKIADTPYEQNGVVVNAVYLARKGDTIAGIATRIYGNDSKLRELAKLNPALKTRDVKVGEKVYYNSPNRPTDNTKLLTYYEDMGLTPETYVVSKPENIRDIAKNLFGDLNSWKELWSTNFDVESKGVLPEGTQLRYWAGTPATTIAQSDIPPAPPADAPPAAPMDAPPPPPPMDAPPPPTDQAMNDPNAMPPPADMQAPPPPPAEMPPPPPPTAEAPPPPPPPPADMPPADGGETAMGTLENPDQTMAMGAGAILLLGAVALFIMIRKRKARRQIDFHTSTQTQIE
jgi:hypothetical protein